jgi:hypothetical protein
MMISTARVEAFDTMMAWFLMGIRHFWLTLFTIFIFDATTVVII